MKTKLTKTDIPRHCYLNQIALGDDYSLLVEVKHDDSMGPPWEECAGHGPVSEWTGRDKRPGEWVLVDNGTKKRFYDFQNAMKEARKNWGLSDEHKAELTKKLGRTPTSGEIANEAVRRDFNLLKGWCDGEWEYLTILVTLLDPNDCEIGCDSMGGVESFGDYRRECVADMGTTLIDNHLNEITEAAYWEARGVQTGAPTLAN